MTTFTSVIQRVNYYLVHLIALLLPFYPKITPWMIGILLLTSFFQDSWSFRRRLLRMRSGYIWVIWSVYLLYIIGVFYSNDTGSALKHLETKLSFFIFPLMLLTTSIVRSESIREILRTYVYGVSLSALVCLILGLYRVYLSEDWNTTFLFYDHYSVFHHPSYFAMYLNLAIAILLLFVFDRGNRVNPIQYILLLFLLVSVYLTASKMGLIVTALTLVIAFAVEVVPRIRWVKSLVLLTITTMIAILIMLKSDFVFNRFKEARDVVTATESNLAKDESSSSVRIKMWDIGVEMFAERPLFGFGTGDSKKTYVARFEERELEKAASHNYNMHNQYLEMALALGVIGIGALIAILLMLFVFSVRQKVMLGLFFSINCGMNFMVESMFEKQSGVIFFVFFVTILFYTFSFQDSDTSVLDDH